MRPNTAVAGPLFNGLHQRLVRDCRNIPCVRSEAEHQAARIPGARHICVFEIAFLDRMGGIAAPGENRILCVHGNAETTHEARMAAEKLVRAGYPEVLEFPSGIKEWMAAGASRTCASKAS